MHRVSIFLVCAATVAVTVHASQKWPSIGKFVVPSGGTATILLDTASLTRNGDVWTARQKTLYSAAQKTAAGLSFQSELDMYAYDCAVNRTALVTYTRYEGADINGTVVEKKEASSAGQYDWTSPSAGSVLEGSRKMVCALAGMMQGKR
jgi:hypothetical protein